VSAEHDERLAPYDYALPEALVARYPAPRREDARLMVLRGGRRSPCEPAEHRRVFDLPGLLLPGDLLVVNDTRVLPARLGARRRSGGSVELFVLEPHGAVARCLLRPGRRLSAGERLKLERAEGGAVEGPSAEGGAASVERWVELLSLHEDGSWDVAFDRPVSEVMEELGAMPLPPYLGRPAERLDRDRYQTVYAGPSGAVAAPTAGLHLSAEVLAALHARGVALARVTLHVGAGTFRNLRPADLDAGELHPERWSIPVETAAAITTAQARGGRVVAVGTTTTRTLESAADERGRIEAGEGETRIFIREGHRFRVVGGLLTNLHLPKSSLLMLVAAFAGRARVMGAYGVAVEEGYRFFSYGDAMLLLP
jgi:S-adenosylmethionine:tRNA ribosyltransferase-isomerase